MKLYEVPNDTKIKVIRDVKTPPSSTQINEQEILHFYHLDGMYSYCKNSNDEVVHLVAWAEVQPIT